MDFYKNKTLILLLITMISHFAFGSTVPVSALDGVRSQIDQIERDLLRTKETQIGAQSQLKKVKRLLELQKKEISLVKTQVKDVENKLRLNEEELKAMEKKVSSEKIFVRNALKRLQQFSDSDGDSLLDARWLLNLEVEQQWSYILRKSIDKSKEKLVSFQMDCDQFKTLAKNMEEEKLSLEAVLQDLEQKTVLLSMNEKVQKEILNSNRASRLDALEKMKSLKDSETQLSSQISSMIDYEGSQTASLASSLASMKGKLPSPAQGEILSGFGKTFDPKTNLLTFQKGITLATKADSSVQAVADGKVVYVGPLKNYGNLVIIEHLGSYFTLYGQLKESKVKTGDSLKQGVTVGFTSEVPLYFEIRNKNVAVNPKPWIHQETIALAKERE